MSTTLDGMRRAIAVLMAMMVSGAAPAIQPEPNPPDVSTRQRADVLAKRAIAYLRAQQDEKTGGWNHDPDGPNLPAITGLVVSGMLDDPDIDASDPAVRRGVEYMLGFRQPDGGIYDRILPSYNTAICLSALAKADTQRTRRVVPSLVRFLKGLQFHEQAIRAGEAGRTTDRVGPDHPFYGGIGYGRNGRPDNSNLHFFMRALEDAGVPSDDPAVRRAVTFLERTQMLDSANDMSYADGSAQGGFIYSTSPSADEIGVGESKAGMVTETLDDGTRVSRLRAYGSMTYAGFKSYAYADLDRDDPRVEAARGWIRRHYTLEENPGLGDEGRYYYYLTFARALAAFGRDTIETIGESGERVRRDWRADLVEALAELQNSDGSFRTVNSRWMEDDPVLITAYALISLQNVRAEERRGNTSDTGGPDE